MKIKILGTRGEIKSSAPYHSRHAGVLIDGKILLDFGEKEFLQYRPKYIFITHLHHDHAVFGRKEVSTNIPIYAPEKYKNGVQVEKVKSSQTLNGYHITAVPTIHSRHVKSVAYIIQRGKNKILYTGDVATIEKKYFHLFKNLDLVIMEGSFIRRGGLIRKIKKAGGIYGHAGIPDLMKLFATFTNCVILTHFGSWFYRDMKKARKKIAEAAVEYNLHAEVGYDGLEINI